MKTRCGWTQDKPLMNEYHDAEWGVPLHDDGKEDENVVTVVIGDFDTIIPDERKTQLHEKMAWNAGMDDGFSKFFTMTRHLFKRYSAEMVVKDKIVDGSVAGSTLKISLPVAPSVNGKKK